MNIGNSAEHTILELAERITKMTGSNSTIGCEPLPESDPVCRRPDIVLAPRHLGWHQEIDLVESLMQTIKWFQEAGDG